ncbi:MAG: hypothetical protein KGL35_22865, partial [Bradyrhizobium sp.]|nr:hypothetical protein [Bradyrhizobium sp.]
DIKPNELAMAIFGGHDGASVWNNMMDASRGYYGGRFAMHGTAPRPLSDALESGVRVESGGAINVLEAGTDIAPSQFANISAFNAVTAGLYEAKILEIYQRPEFIAQQLAKTEPSVRRAEKIVGVSLIGDVAEERKPGNEHKRATLSERYVTGPVTQNKALAIDITREAIMFDYSKQLMTQAEKVGEAMAMRREYLTIQTVLGVHNTYTYDGTNYTTYLASSDNGNWVNKLASNAITDWTNLNSVEKLLTQMTDQETGQPINVPARQILVMPARYESASYALKFTQVERASSGAGAGGLNTALAERGFGPNPYNGRYELLPGSIWVRRIATNLTTDPIAKGLGLTDTNADQYSWIGDFQRAFQYSQQLPLTTIRVDANNYEMANRGLVYSIFIDEMGIPMVLDPRFVVMSTN